MILKNIYLTLIRHAPTAHNQGGIITGRKDVPLSVEGRAFAERFVTERGRLQADVVVTSPLLRAKSTAEILFGVPQSNLIQEPLCLERNYGAMEGASQAEIAAMGVRYISVGGIDHSLNPPGGESFEALRGRADRLLASLMSYPVDHVACVAHQSFLQQAVGALRGLTVHDALAIDLRPLAIHRFILTEGGTVDESEVFPGAVHIPSW